MLKENGKLRCDMSKECNKPVTHIGSKGYVYCQDDAIVRRQSSAGERTRKMLKREIRQLEEGKPLANY